MSMNRFYGTRDELLQYVSRRLQAVYGIEAAAADAMSPKLFDAIEEHAGNPFNLDQTEQVIQVVAKNWLKR